MELSFYGGKKKKKKFFYAIDCIDVIDHTISPISSHVSIHQSGSWMFLSNRHDELHHFVEVSTTQSISVSDQWMTLLQNVEWDEEGEEVEGMRTTHSIRQPQRLTSVSSVMSVSSLLSFSIFSFRFFFCPFVLFSPFSLRLFISLFVWWFYCVVCRVHKTFPAQFPIRFRFSNQQLHMCRVSVCVLWPEQQNGANSTDDKQYIVFLWRWYSSPSPTPRPFEWIAHCPSRSGPYKKSNVSAMMNLVNWIIIICHTTYLIYDLVENNWSLFKRIILIVVWQYYIAVDIRICASPTTLSSLTRCSPKLLLQNTVAANHIRC